MVAARAHKPASKVSPNRLSTVPDMRSQPRRQSRTRNGSSTGNRAGVAQPEQDGRREPSKQNRPTNVRLPASTIQRTITVFGANVDSGGLRGAVEQWNNQQRQLSQQEKGALRAAISAANHANAQNGDAPDKATAILGNYNGFNLLSPGNKLRIKGILEDLLGAQLASGMTTQTEVDAFDLLLTRATVTSRSKRVTNQVAIAQLPDALSTAVRNQVDAAKARHLTLKAKSSRTAKRALLRGKPEDLGPDAATGMVGIRSPHYNTDNWLPDRPVNGIANLGGVQRGLTTEEVAQVYWYGYTKSVNNDDSAFIEFNMGTISQIGGWRVLYDYTTGDFYLTLHYNWHKGYNPFFKLTDA